ncbi:MAG: FAD-dependent oxidoreductase [Deltaproteobacteria bacterium]|nr:FAD-dependent oxidoreductase [Deltaproteobacteria bacterium]
MDLPSRADVVVVGGGVIGASVACRLAENGVDVLLLERGEIASGSSGACDRDREWHAGPG